MENKTFTIFSWILFVVLCYSTFLIIRYLNSKPSGRKCVMDFIVLTFFSTLIVNGLLHVIVSTVWKSLLAESFVVIANVAATSIGSVMTWMEFQLITIAAFQVLIVKKPWLLGKTVLKTIAKITILVELALSIVSDMVLSALGHEST